MKLSSPALDFMRSLRAEPRPPRNSENAIAQRLLDHELVEEFGAPLFFSGSRVQARKMRLTPKGEGRLKGGVVHCPMLPGYGERHDCIHIGTCLTALLRVHPSAGAAHCPEACSHRQDVRREQGGFGDSALAAMQVYAPGAI